MADTDLPEGEVPCDCPPGYQHLPDCPNVIDQEEEDE